MHPHFHVESVLLIISSVLLAIALSQRHALALCHRPLATWLGVLCELVYAFSATFAMGRFVEGGGDWWFIEPRVPAAKVAFRATWSVLVPLALIWTLLGARWLFETLDLTPECFDSAFPEKALSPVFFIFVLACCILGALIYLLLVGCVWDVAQNRRANAAVISAVSDEDLDRRWGRQEVASTPELQGGLRPEDLAELPRMVHKGSSDEQCVVCLCRLDEGDIVRVLPTCKHTFHRPCIDLWLLRNYRCPLCGIHACGDCKDTS